MLIDVSVIYSFNSLELYSQKMFNCNLRVRMAKTIGSPSNFVLIFELFIEEIHSERVLVNNIIIVANSLIILHPCCITDLELFVIKQFFYLLFFIFSQKVIPVLKEDSLGDKIFSIGV